MHELSLAESILKTVLKKAKEHNLKAITKVRLCVGRHFYLEEHGLKDCWSMVAKDSIATASKLVVKLNESESPEGYFIESIEGD